MTDSYLVDVMLRYGGSFVQALAQCWLRADAQNRARLKAAFPDVWAEYSDIANHLVAKG